MVSRCSRCDGVCDGSFMRMNPRFNRVKNMLSVEEIPKHKNGGIGLCHVCQRAVYFSNGYLKLLIKDLKNQANKDHLELMKSGILNCPKCGSDARYEKTLPTRIKYTCKNCRHDYTKHSSSVFASPKISDELRQELFKALKTKNIKQAAEHCGVSYKTAYRMKYLEELNEIKG